MRSRPNQSLAIALPDDDAGRLRRGIGTAMLLASAMWIGLFYTVLLIE